MKDISDYTDQELEAEMAFRAKPTGLALVLKHLESAGRSRVDMEAHHVHVDDASYEFLRYIQGSIEVPNRIADFATRILTEKDQIREWWYA